MEWIYVRHEGISTFSFGAVIAERFYIFELTNSRVIYTYKLRDFVLFYVHNLIFRHDK